MIHLVTILYREKPMAIDTIAKSTAARRAISRDILRASVIQIPA